jgi:hypothetical protein
MKITEELIQENLKSWERIIEFYEEFNSYPHWKYIKPLERLVKQLSRSRHAKYFRAGQGLWHLMISTVEKHGLNSEDFYVFVTLNVDLKRENNQVVRTVKNMQVIYKQGPNEIESQTCDEKEIMTTIEPFLQRLWNETKGEPGNYYE